MKPPSRLTTPAPLGGPLPPPTIVPQVAPQDYLRPSSTVGSVAGGPPRSRSAMSNRSDNSSRYAPSSSQEIMITVEPAVRTVQLERCIPYVNSLCSLVHRPPASPHLSKPWACFRLPAQSLSYLHHNSRSSRQFRTRLKWDTSNLWVQLWALAADLQLKRLMPFLQASCPVSRLAPPHLPT